MGVSLTGEEELHGIVGVVDNLRQTLQVGEEQVSTLVGSKAATETDEQCVGVNLVEQGYDARGVTLVLQPSLTILLAHVVDELVLQCHTGLPDLFVGHIVDGLPNLLFRLVVPEVLIEVGSIELFPLGSTPSGEVNTVGHITYVVLFWEVTLPDGRKHLLRNLAVEPAYTVHLLRGVASED